MSVIMLKYFGLYYFFFYLHTGAYLLMARTVEPERQLLLVNGSSNIAVARKWFSSRHLIAARDVHVTMEESLEAVFPVQSKPRQYNEDQLPL
jgi:hypothetical protein